MSTKPIVAVTGATGQQGGSVARGLLRSGKCAVRAVVRSPDSDAAQALAAQGAEIVYGDLDKPDTIVSAFTGADAAFLVTTVWNPFGGGKDTNYPQGKLLADSAKSANVGFVVWSTMHNFEEMSGGKLKIEGFSNKNRIEQYIKEIGLPAAFVSPAMYMSMWNMDSIFGVPTRTPDGTTVMASPLRAEVGLPVIDIEDISKFVVPMFENPERWRGARVLAAAEYLTASQMAHAYTEVTGEPVVVRKSDPSELPLQLMMDTVEGVNTYGYYGGEYLEDSHSLYDELKLNTLKDWLRRTGFRAKERQSAI